VNNKTIEAKRSIKRNYSWSMWYFHRCNKR